MAFQQDFSDSGVKILSKEQKQTLRRVFDEIDGDHNGRLSEPEIKRAAKKIGLILSNKDIKLIMKEADSDGSGYIEYKEFEKKLGPHILIAEEKKSKYMEYFNQFDKDGDGFITRKELKIALKEQGEQLSSAEIQQLFNEADANNDGVIDFDEFCEIVFE